MKKLKSSFIQHDFQEDNEDTEAWSIPYGNLMTFLMIFFFLLYAFTFWGNKIDYEKVVNNVQMQLAKIDLELKKHLETKKAETEFASKFKDFVKNQEIQGATVDINAKKIRIILNEKAILFPSGSDVLNEPAKKILDNFVDIFSSLTDTQLLLIEGYTDNIPIRTSKFKNNWELSIARAISVLNYFVIDKGMDPKKFAIAGYGEYKPIAPNDTEENRSKNRRIELVIMRKSEQ